MLWFGIVPLLWCLALREMWFSKSEFDMLTWPRDFMGWVTTALLLVLIAIGGGGLAALVAGTIGTMADNSAIWHLEDRFTEPLVSIRDKDGVNGAIGGSLFLVSGYFESRPYYFYYTQDENGVIRPDKVLATRSVFIHEITDGSQPKYVEKQWDNGRPWLDLIAFTEGGWQYHFYVPKGTVRRDFSM